MKYIPKALFLGTIVFLAMLAGYILPRLPSSLGETKFENRTGTKIDVLSFEACDSKFEFHDIPTAATWLVKFPVTHDSSYKVEARLSSGETINARGGYVARGIDSIARIMVLPNEISFEYDAGP